jgi:hypothetical protein
LSAPLPATDTNSFELRLAAEEPWARIAGAIRDRTPTSAVLVVDESDLHLPTLTHRTLYFPPDQQLPHPGVNIKSYDTLVHSRRYSVEMLNTRRVILNQFFHSPDGAQRGDALERMRSLNRPVAVIVERQRHAELLDWLAMERNASVVFEEPGRVLWLNMPGESSWYSRSSTPDR